MKTEQVAEMLKPLMDKIEAKTQISFIFGSVATGYDDETADKNLVTIGKLTSEELEEAVAEVKNKIEDKLVVNSFTRDDYIKHFLGGKIFIRKSANAPKTFFKGNDGDLWDLYYDA